MNFRSFGGAAYAVLALASTANAQEADDILVTASRADAPLEADDYGGSANVLTATRLEQRQVRDVADVLRDVPGVAVSAVPGQTQLRLRGSEGNHVLVLVDGIEVSDPFAGEFDFSTLQAEPGSRVEVLRGPQSALYGSDAIGGVVAYTTASGRDLPGVQARVEAGNFGVMNAAARAGLASESYGIALGGMLVSTDGTPNTRGGSRRLGRDILTLSAKGDIDLSSTANLRAVGRYVTAQGDFNEQDFDPTSPTLGLAVDTPGVAYRSAAFHALVGASVETAPNWTHDLSGQITDVSRDVFAGDLRTSGSEGQRLKGSYVTSVSLRNAALTHDFTFAADVERESYRNTDPFEFAFTGERSARNFGLVGEYRLAGEGFDLAAAARRDFNNRFANSATYRISGGLDLGETSRVRGAAGSGVKNPGFYELFGFVDGRYIGNPDLEPEKSKGWEIGFDQSLADDRIRFSATYFQEQLTGEIFTEFPAPDFIATPANRAAKSARKGLELAARAQFGPHINIDAAYTRLDATEFGQDEVRRPGNIGSFALNWAAPGDAASATLVVRYDGATDDVAFTDPSFVPVRVQLGSYTLVNVNMRARLSERFEAFGRVENLLDEQYEQVFSFTNPGRSFVVGVSASL